MNNPLTGSGTALLIVGLLNALTSLVLLISGMLRFTVMGEQLPADEAERLGFLIATVLTYGFALVSLLLSPIVIYSSIKMLKGKSSLARVSAFIVLLPFSSCCFVIGVPIGIWVLAVLAKDDTKAFLSGELIDVPPAPPSLNNS